MGNKEIVLKFALRSVTNPYPAHYNNLYNNILNPKLKSYVLAYFAYKILFFSAEIIKYKSEEFNEELLQISFKIRKEDLTSEILGKIIGDLVVIFKSVLLEIIAIDSNDTNFSECKTIYNQ